MFGFFYFILTPTKDHLIKCPEEDLHLQQVGFEGRFFICDMNKFTNVNSFLGCSFLEQSSTKSCRSVEINLLVWKSSYGLILTNLQGVEPYVETDTIKYSMPGRRIGTISAAKGTGPSEDGSASPQC